MLEFKYHTYQERKPAEFKGNNLFDTVFELSTDAFFILDNADMSIVDCNSAAIKLFEARSKSQLLGLPSFRLYNYEPSQFSSDSYMNELNIKGEYSQDMSFRTLRQNVFWGRLTRTQVNDSNGNFIVLKVLKAANYLKDEEALSTLLNGTAKTTGQKFFSELTRLLSKTFNAKYAFVAKCSSTLSQMDIIDFWSEGDVSFDTLPIANSVVENVVKGYTSFYPSNTTEMFPKDNMVKELGVESFMGAPIFDSTGRTVGVIGVMHTRFLEEIPNSRYLLSIFASRSAAEIQRMKSKELLREQTRELAFANHMKDRLLSVLSNDLKAPLHTILSYADIIGERMHTYNTEQLSDKFEILDNSIRNLYSILENITDWSKIQNNELVIKPERVSFSSLITTNYAIIEPLANLKSIEFVNEIDEEYVWADAHLVDSVLRNLLSFAVKYSTKGGKIHFNSKVEDNKLKVEFSDSCIDFDEDEMAQYWNTAETIPELLSTEQNHHAIGIYLIRDFMQRMDGNIQYQYQKGMGYTYRFELPYAEK